MAGGLCSHVGADQDHSPLAIGPRDQCIRLMIREPGVETFPDLSRRITEQIQRKDFRIAHGRTRTPILHTLGSDRDIHHIVIATHHINDDEMTTIDSLVPAGHMLLPERITTTMARGPRPVILATSCAKHPRLTACWYRCKRARYGAQPGESGQAIAWWKLIQSKGSMEKFRRLILEAGR